MFQGNVAESGNFRWDCSNRTTRSKLRLLQHVWIFQGLGPSSTSLHYIPVFPVSFLSKILMTENTHSTHVRLNCYFKEVRTWWKMHCDILGWYHLKSWCHMMSCRRGYCRCSEEGACSRQRPMVGWMAKHWQSIPLPWFKQAKFTLSSCYECKCFFWLPNMSIEHPMEQILNKHIGRHLEPVAVCICAHLESPASSWNIQNVDCHSPDETETWKRLATWTRSPVNTFFNHLQPVFSGWIKIDVERRRKRWRWWRMWRFCFHDAAAEATFQEHTLQKPAVAGAMLSCCPQPHVLNVHVETISKVLTSSIVHRSSCITLRTPSGKLPIQDGKDHGIHAKPSAWNP